MLVYRYPMKTNRLRLIYVRWQQIITEDTRLFNGEAGNGRHYERIDARIFGVVWEILIIWAYMTRSEPNLFKHESEKYFTDPQKSSERILFPSLEDSGTLELSVVVPAYNEELRLPSMLDEALSYLEHRQVNNPSFNYEVIIVDDGSGDSTTKVGLKYSLKYGADKVRVLMLAKNKGKGGAVRMGMLSARGKLLLFADGDGATKFSDVEKLETEMRKMDSNEDNYAVVCGSRAHLEKDSIAQRSLFRTFLMYGFHFLVWFLCVKSIKDTQCGFKMFTREAARLLFYNLHVERWAFDVDLLHIAEHFNIPVSEVAVNWQEIEGSKLSPLWSSLQMGRDLFLIRLRYLLGVWEMKSKPKAQ